jgi:hypothetical protein
MNLALNNVYCANTHPSSVILGLAHGSYGVGGIVAPIAGTSLVSNGILWSRFYFLAVGLRICCIGFAAWAFWSYKEESEPTLLTALEATSSRQTTTEDAANKFKELKLALKSKVTIFGALFIFAYQGAEVSISGWIISYLINYRDGDPAKVGYVTAGFWVRTMMLPTIALIANKSPGRHHIRSIRPDTRRTQDWREELRSHAYHRHIRTAASRMANSQRHRQRCRSMPVGFAPWSRLPLRADHLLAHSPSKPAEHCYWLHWRSWKFWRRCCSVHHGYSCTGYRYLGASSSLFGTVCCDDGMLVRLAKGTQADRIDARRRSRWKPKTASDA